MELETWNSCLEARGGVEPRALPPNSVRFGLEDRCRERGPDPSHKFQVQSSGSTSAWQTLKPGTWNLKLSIGRGVRPTRLCELHDPEQSPFCRDESRPEKPSRQLAVGRKQGKDIESCLLPTACRILSLVPKEGLKPSTSGL